MKLLILNWYADTALTSCILKSNHLSAANLATLQSYRPLLSDYGPPSFGFSQVNATQFNLIFNHFLCMNVMYL